MSILSVEYVISCTGIFSTMLEYGSSGTRKVRFVVFGGMTRGRVEQRGARSDTSC